MTAETAYRLAWWCASPLHLAPAYRGRVELALRGVDGRALPPEASVAAVAALCGRVVQLRLWDERRAA